MRRTRAQTLRVGGLRGGVWERAIVLTAAQQLHVGRLVDDIQFKDEGHGDSCYGSRNS